MWPFRKLRESDMFTRPPDPVPEVVATGAPDLMPEDVPPPVAKGFEGFPLRKRPQEFDPDAVEWTDVNEPLSG